MYGDVFSQKCVTCFIAPEVYDVSYFTRDVRVIQHVETVVVQVPLPVSPLSLLSPGL